MSNIVSLPSTAQKLRTPQSIHVPEWLETELESTNQPNIVDHDFLLELGKRILTAKVRHVEDFNMTVRTAKKRIPEKLDFDDVAIILLSLYTFKNVQMTERREDTILAYYNDDPNSDRFGIYDANIRHMFEIMERIAPNFKNKDMQDVLDKIQRSVDTVEPNKDRHLFIVNNGIYDQKKDRLYGFSEDYVFLTKIPINYNPNAISPVITAPDGYQWEVEEWIRDLADNDPDTNLLIWQVIADCLQPNHSRYKSIWFYSEKGNNGKGTIGQMIKNLLGRGNYASLSVADFNHEYLKETLLGAAANIADENDVDIFIDSVKDYKASITGDDININRKYEKPLRIQFMGTNIQMMNGLPKTKDKSDSFYRRLILVPFIKSFTNNGERKYIKDDYIHRPEVLEYVLKKALSIVFNEYITPDSSLQLLANYKEKNNPVLEFWNELADEFVWDLLPTQFLYDLFVKWSALNNPSGKVMSKRSFTDSLNAIIHSQNEPWDIKTGQNDKVRTQNKMDKDEPLITEYGLDLPDRGGNASPWARPNYKGNDPVTRRNFIRKPAYRGYVRL